MFLTRIRFKTPDPSLSYFLRLFEIGHVESINTPESLLLLKYSIIFARGAQAIGDQVASAKFRDVADAYIGDTYISHLFAPIASTSPDLTHELLRASLCMGYLYAASSDSSRSLVHQLTALDLHRRMYKIKNENGAGDFLGIYLRIEEEMDYSLQAELENVLGPRSLLSIESAVLLVAKLTAHRTAPHNQPALLAANNFILSQAAFEKTNTLLEHSNKLLESYELTPESDKDLAHGLRAVVFSCMSKVFWHAGHIEAAIQMAQASVDHSSQCSAHRGSINSFDFGAALDFAVSFSQENFHDMDGFFCAGHALPPDSLNSDVSHSTPRSCPSVVHTCRQASAPTGTNILLEIASVFHELDEQTSVEVPLPDKFESCPKWTEDGFGFEIPFLLDP